MCPKPNDTSSALSKKSHVETYSDPIPALFTALMSEADTQERWTTVTFPVDFYTDPYRPKLEKEFKYWTRKSLCLGVWFRWQLVLEAVITDVIHKLIASGAGAHLSTLKPVEHPWYFPFVSMSYSVVPDGICLFGKKKNFFPFCSWKCKHFMF
jgi:hypothetical protein